MADYEGKQILVLGLGISGFAAARLARTLGAEVTVLDTITSDVLHRRASALAELGVRVELGWNSDTWSEPTDLVVISPGIGPLSPYGRLADTIQCTVVGELEFGFSCCSCPVLAVTGTNGKTTCVELATHCLRAAGYRAMAAGNVGVPLSEVCLKTTDLDFLVVEVSSFQLERAHTFTPYAAALLNVSSDHQDRYSTFSDYVRTKLRLFGQITNAGRVVVKEELLRRPELREHPLFSRQFPFTFSSCGPGKADYFIDNEGLLCCRSSAGVVKLTHRDKLQMRGAHNLENALAVLGLCRAVGAPLEPCVSALEEFTLSAHRLEPICTSRGIRFVNDSKATNPDAVIQALLTCGQTLSDNGRILLIAGGRDKEMDFEPVKPYLQQYVDQAFLLGESKDRLAHLWEPVVTCTSVPTLEAAVDGAIALATEGDVVLMSPGCASQDMFEDYAHRGNQFKKALNRRLGNAKELS